MGILFSIFAISSFAADCKVNEPDISGEYVGDCLNGLAHGRGKAKGRDTYDGGFVQGNQHGKGIYTWASTDRYEGDWLNGKKHGKGIYTWPNNARYEGDWLNDKKHGKGVLVLSSGSKYEGDFLDDFRSGKGIFWGLQGEYIGSFLKGKKHGFGRLTYSRSTPKATIDSWKDKGHGSWAGDTYVIEGIFKEDELSLSCISLQNCKQEQAKRDAQEKREQDARRADDDRRRAYENSPAGVAARQGRQMCEAQKQTCYASCPPYNDRLTAFGANNAHFQCNSRCGKSVVINLNEAMPAAQLMKETSVRGNPLDRQPFLSSVRRLVRK